MAGQIRKLGEGQLVLNVVGRNYVLKHLYPFNHSFDYMEGDKMHFLKQKGMEITYIYRCTSNGCCMQTHDRNTLHASDL